MRIEEQEIYVDVMDAAVINVMESLLFICKGEEILLDEDTQARASRSSYSFLIHLIFRQNLGNQFIKLKEKGEREGGRLFGPSIGLLITKLWNNESIKKLYENWGEYSKLSSLDYAEL